MDGQCVGLAVNRFDARNGCLYGFNRGYLSGSEQADDIDRTLFP
jgi:hypothetical protein